MARRDTMEMTPEHPETEIEEEFYYIVEGLVETEATGSDTTQAILPEKYLEISGDCEELPEVISPSNGSISSSLRCRLCAIPRNDMVDVFRPNVKGLNIVQKIEYCLCIMVTESDSLPKQVCTLCLEKLEMCYNFNESVAEAEKQLLALDSQPAGEAEETEKCETLSVRNEDCDVTDDCCIVGTFQAGASTVAEEEGITDTIEVIDLTSASSKTCSLELDPSMLNPTKTGGRDNLNKILKRNSTDDGWHVAIPWRYNNVDGTPLKMNPDVEIEFESKTVKVSEISATNKIVESNESSTVANKDRSKDDCCVAIPWQCDDTEKAFKIDLDIDVNYESEIKEVAVATATPQHNLQSSHGPRSSGDGKNSKSLERSATYASVYVSERRYQCNVCPKVFKSKEYLNRHSKFHTGNGLFGCKYCGKKFLCSQDRSQHHNVHTGQQPFKCSVCGKRFSHDRAMKRHAVVHSDARNYPCSLCDMSFKTVAVRKKHMLVHSSEKSLRCDNCETHFKCKDKLRRHMREVHFSLYKRKSTGVWNY